MGKAIEKRLNRWYLLLMVGALMIFLSIWVFLTPLSSFLSMAWVLSLGFIITGAVEIVYSFTNRQNLRSWGWSLVGGIITLITGLLLVTHPVLSALMLSIYVGIWLLLRSFLHIFNAFALKRNGMGSWGWVLFLGILSSLMSFFLLANPTVTGLLISYVLGFGLFFFGSLQIVLAFGIRKVKNRIKEVREGFTEYEEVS